MKKALSKRKRVYTARQWVFYWAVLALPLLQFLIFYVYINFNSIMFSFQKYDLRKGAFIGNGLNNFKDVFHTISSTSYLKAAFRNSVVLFFAKIAIGTTFGLLFAYYIFKKRRFHGVFKTFLFLPSIIPPISMALIFYYFGDQALPKITSALFGFKMKGLFSYYDSLFSIVLGYSLYMGFGYQVLLYSGAMGNVSESTLEAATLDGANALQEFIYIILPGIWGTLVTFVVVDLAALFTDQMNLFSFFGGGVPVNDMQTIGYYLYIETSKNVGVYTAYPTLSAFGLICTLITLVATVAVKKLLNKIGPTEG